jgi:hypothetical protein
MRVVVPFVGDGLPVWAGLVFLVSWLHRSCMVAPFVGAGVWGVWYGVVV